MIRKALTIVAVLGLTVMAAPNAFAPPCGTPTPMSNLGGLFITGCQDNLGPVTAHAFQLGTPANNTGNGDLVCETNLGPGTECTTSPDNTPNDGKVAIEMDWFNPYVTQCPVPNRVVFILTCNDNTSGVAFTLAGTDPNFGYQVELAFPYDDASGASLPLHAGGKKSGKARVESFTRNAGNDMINVAVDTPDANLMSSDCDPGTLGLAVDGAFATLNCGAFTKPTVARGNLYSSTQPCGPGSRPDIRRVGGQFPWTSRPFDAGTGTGMLTLPTAPTGQCNYVGSTLMIGGLETSGIIGYTGVGNQNANSPLAEGLAVGKKTGSIELTFHTSSELGLAGFNVYAVGKKGESKLNAALILAQGAGGAASYTLTFTLAELKGSRSLIVESVMSDNTTVRAPRFDF